MLDWPPCNEFILIAALAKALNVSKATVYRWRDSGLPSIKLGNVTLFHEPAVAAWLKSRERVEPPQD